MSQRGRLRVEQKDKAPEERKTPVGNSRTEASYTQNHVLGHPEDKRAVCIRWGWSYSS